ncbi:MAG: hypothetical protein L0G54_14655 [Brevibacterium sp.]|nr:hypothetical protein [Brevibacterium sp.]
MTTINSTRYSVRTASDGIHHVFDEKTGKSVDIETDRGIALRMAEARNYDDSLPAPKHLSWCIPERCTSHGGPDVIHEGKTMRLERSNKNGDSFSFSATPTQLEERGFGYTTEKYVSLTIDSEPFGITHLNIDIDELEGAVDWMCGVVEKVKSQGDGPGLKL